MEEIKMIPKEYTSKLSFTETERGIKLVKDTFEKKLGEKLSLQRVSAPRFLRRGTGLQDDLAGTQVPVSFQIKSGEKVEIVHSLAKWKRFTLGKHKFKPGTGLYTDMDAIRKDEDLSEIHSHYVDQWDWERVISREERSLEFLKKIVKYIYQALLETETIVEKKFPQLKSRLPQEIKFIHAQELEDLFPELTPKQREDAIAKRYGAVFIIGIGGKLKSGKVHDLRAADYDDWELDGDIIVWDSVRGKSLELSSMGIRVDKDSLLKQLKITGQEKRKKLPFHQEIIKETLPLTIGGGIGQSRSCMFLLQKAHIGEVHSSVWPQEVIEEFERQGIALL